MKSMTILKEQPITISVSFEIDPVGSPLQIGAYRGVKFAVVVTTVLAMSDLTPVIEVFSPTTGLWEVALVGAAITVPGGVTLTVHPDLTPSATEASAAIADRFRLSFRVTGAGGRAAAGLTMLA